MEIYAFAVGRRPIFFNLDCMTLISLSLCFSKPPFQFVTGFQFLGTNTLALSACWQLLRRFSSFFQKTPYSSSRGRDFDYPPAQFISVHCILGQPLFFGNWGFRPMHTPSCHPVRPTPSV